MKMNVAIDARNLITPISGIGRYIYNSSRFLASLGCTIHLLVPGKLHDDFGDLAHVDRLKIHTHAAPTALGRLAWGTAVLPSAVADIAPDVFWAPAHRLSGQVASQFPTVLTIHDLVWIKAPQTMLLHRRLSEAMMMGRAIEVAERVVCVSRQTSVDLEEHFPFASRKTSVVYPAVQLARSVTTGPSLSEFGVHGPFVLCVGTREPRKNYVSAICAFAELGRDVARSHQLVIAGAKGWKSAAIDRAAAAMEGRVILLDHVSDATLACLYENCVGLLMPSHYEGFGFPVVEAQAFGKRVVASSNTSLVEVAGDRVIEVDAASVESIKEGLRRLILEPWDVTEANAAMINAARFLPEVSTGLLVEVFSAAQTSWNRRAASVHTG